MAEHAPDLMQSVSASYRASCQCHAYQAQMLATHPLGLFNMLAKPEHLQRVELAAREHMEKSFAENVIVS